MLKSYLRLIIFLIFAFTNSYYVYADELASTISNKDSSSVPKIKEQDKSPLKWLQQMQQAQHNNNYEISFINVDINEIKSLRYRHFKFNKNNYAQLITLEGSQQEIIRVDDLVGYFQSNYPSFSLKSSHIVDYLPSILWGDINELNKNYDVVNIGLNRIADRLVQTFRILPKDDFRYQYVVFIDTKSHLLLRSDILDRQGNLLEQYLVVNLVFSDQVETLAQYFSNINFPPLLKEENNDSLDFNWKPSWLPKGFKLINQLEQKDKDNNIETQIYSDGIFSFSINVSNKFIPNEEEKGWKQGILTLYTMNRENRELTFTGQLPISTAKRILEDIKFN